VTTVTQAAIRRDAGELVRGDVIAPRFLPESYAATVDHVIPYTLGGEPWVFVIYIPEGGVPGADYFLAERPIPLAFTAADMGFSYTRADSDDDDPTPISPARVPLHTGSVVDGAGLIVDGGRS
jgi:hypothetical protein